MCVLVVAEVTVPVVAKPTVSPSAAFAAFIAPKLVPRIIVMIEKTEVIFFNTMPAWCLMFIVDCPCLLLINNSLCLTLFKIGNVTR